MNIQEENSALYFRVESEREQTLISIGNHMGLSAIWKKNCTEIGK